ncbi:MAG: phytanoyl-CoA dioxygenase family protein [Planctomycetota bacterium]
MSEWNTPCTVSDAQRHQYHEDGFAYLRGILDPQLLVEAESVISGAVARLRADRHDRPLSERSFYEKAFLQTQNLWQHDETVHPIVFSKRLASIAAGLMGCERVRLYHDQALFKEPGGGCTPWHADQHYWPLADDRSITAWIPLVDVDMSMGPLSFSIGSHRLQTHRDLAISEDSERLIGEALTLKQLPTACAPFALGDVSFHSGWTFHRAGGNDSQRMRSVMTVIYIADGVRLKTLPRQQKEADHYCPGIAEGEVIASPLNPIIT